MQSASIMRTLLTVGVRSLGVSVDAVINVDRIISGARLG
jgi:hypothetical protein